MNSCATGHVSNDAISSFDARGLAKRFRDATLPDAEEWAKVDVKPSELRR